MKLYLSLCITRETTIGSCHVPKPAIRSYFVGGCLVHTWGAK